MRLRRGMPVAVALALSLAPLAPACGGDDAGQEQDGGGDEGDNGGGGNGPYG
ncbi:MAG TPA: hypothetical protein VHL78_00505 [Actinomycetota bacterium]|nr:hypothetical protein [Actinomycetota bacterium]